MATSAEAVSFNPDNTAVSGTSSNPTLTWGAAWGECASATLHGTTGLDSDRITDFRLEFEEPCSFPGIGPMTPDCSGTATLIADPDADDTGKLEPNEDFRCDFSMGICVITVGGPQPTQPKNTVLDEANDVLSIDWELQGRRTGSVLCGPEFGTVRITADFAMTPANLTIDP